MNMPATCITDLPNVVAHLPAEKRERFERLFQLDASTGICVLPETMHDWTRQHFGNLSAVEHQHILRITNVWTWEGAIYNPVRSGRPLQKLNSKKTMPNSLDDVFAEPEKTTAADAFGRVRGEYCTTTGNIARWEGQHAVVIFDEYDPLKFERKHLRDYFRTAWRWAQQAHQHDPQARYFVWTWNGGLKAGASIPHAHAQVALGRTMHYARIEQLRRAALAYQAQFGKNFFDDVYAAHHDVGLTFERGGLRGLIYLTALRAKDTWILGDAFDYQLADALCDILRDLVERTGTAAFNVCVYMPPIASVPEDWSHFPVIARIVDRGSPDMISSDVGALDIFAHQVIALDPYDIAAKMRQPNVI